MDAHTLPVDHDDSTEEEVAPLALHADDVPEGFITDYPAARRDRRFGVAVPSLITLFVSTAAAGAAAVWLGVTGQLLENATWWTVSLPLVTLAVIGTGAAATWAGWNDDRPAGPWRPIVYGLGVALGLMTAWVAASAFTLQWIV